MRWHLPKDFGQPIEFQLAGNAYRVFPGDNVFFPDNLDEVVQSRGLPLKQGPLNGAGDAQPQPIRQAKQTDEVKQLGKDASLMAHDDGPPIEGKADVGPPDQHIDPMVGANPLAAWDQKRQEQNEQEQQRLARGRKPQQPAGQPLRGAQAQVDEQQRQQHEQHHGKKHE